jgi:multidrug resistance efflux pump
VVVEAPIAIEDRASSRGAYAEQEAQEAQRGLPRPTLLRRRMVALAIVSTLVAAGLFCRTDRVVRADGRLAAKQWAAIRADGSGDLRTRLKRWGDTVHANEAVAMLAPETQEVAVTVAEGELSDARRQLDAVVRQLDRIDEHAVVLPPPSVLDLGAWLEQQLWRRAPGPNLVTETTRRLQSIRAELEARASRIRKRAESGLSKLDPQALDRALESRLARGEALIVDALRLADSKRPLSRLDQAMARYQDAIFDGLCDLAHVSPSVLRGEARAAEGYFGLLSDFRRAQVELRDLQAETTNLSRVHEVYPALAGERHGERRALGQVLEEFVARSKAAREQRKDGLGSDGERLRAEIHRIGEDLLDGVDRAWARIDEGSVSGLGDLEHQVSQLRLGWNALEWALDRQFAAIASHRQGLIARNTLDDKSANAEQQANLFLDVAERLRISAEDLFGKRIGDVEVAIGQKQGAVELGRARLRRMMAAADGEPAQPSDEEHPLETIRARYANDVARAESTLKAAKLALDAKVVRAPIDGVITSVDLERTTLARGESVGVVEDLAGLVFKATVADQDLPGVAVGQPVRLVIDVDNQQRAVEGRVAWIGRDGQVVEKDRPAWNVLVAVEGTPAGLMPALAGRAQIVVGRPTGLERLRDLLHRSPPPVRRYPTPELPDPTRALALPPEPAPESGGVK